MSWWRKLRSLWPGALRQQVTRTGLVYAITVVLVALAAFLSANNLLFLVLAAMLSVLFISGFVSKLSLAGLEFELLLPEHVSARRQIRGAIRLKNLKRWMPSFSIHVEGSPGSGLQTSLYFPVLPGKVSLEEPVHLQFPTRGRWKERAFQFTTRFPFGFAERRDSVTTRYEIIVYPCLDPQPGFEELLTSIAGQLEARRRGQGNDFYRIRPYEAFETARHVDWKATAHTGDLQVREFARDEEQRVIIDLDLAVSENQKKGFEAAVDCCAFLAYELSERGAQIRFRTQEFDMTLPKEGDIYAVLRYLATVAPLQGRSLPAPSASDDADPFRLVLSAHPERFAEPGLADRQNVQVVWPDWIEANSAG
jgi:uncharacterized protein (DUF58 family)